MYRRSKRAYPKRKVGKKSYGTKKSYARPRATVPNYYGMVPARANLARTGVPPMLNLQMKSALAGAVAPAAVYQVYSLKLNSTFDPFGDMGAIQPIGRDQIAALYGSYLVSSGNIKIAFANTGAAPVTMCCYTSSVSSPVTASLNAYVGQPGSRWLQIAPVGSGNATGTIMRTFNSSQILGPLDRSQHGALVGADPTAMAYLHVIIISSSGNVTGQLLSAMVQNTSWYDKLSLEDA